MTRGPGNDICLLITTDTFRWDHFGEGLSPAIDDLKETGSNFRYAYSTGSGTSSAFPGILASAYPLDHGYRGLNDQHTPVAEHLSEAGICTVGITSSSHASSLFNYDRGFDEFLEDVSYREDAVNDPPLSEVIYHRAKQIAMKTSLTRRLGSTILEYLRESGWGTFQYPYQRAETVTDQAIEAIDRVTDERNGKTFVWVHYMEPHSPYYPPDEILTEYYEGDYSKSDVNSLLTKWYENRHPLWTDDNGESFSLSDKEIEVLKAYYRAQVAYLDREIGRLFDWLRERGMYQDSLLLFTADHGEEFFDHGDFGHRQKVYDELTHIPFAVHDGINHGTIDEIVSHTDIGPTVAEWFNVEPAPNWRGESLFPLISGERETLEREYVISELCHRSSRDGYGGEVNLDELITAVITQEWKFIRNKQRGTRELFPLNSSETPENDVANDRPEIVEYFDEIVAEREASVTEASIEREELPEEIRSRLHELGYVGE